MFLVGIVEGDAHQRPAIDVPIGRVEIEIIAAMAHHRAMGGDGGGAQISLDRCLLPLGAPFRHALRHIHHLDRPTAGIEDLDIAARDEAESLVVEIVAVELVDGHAQRAGADEGIDDLVLEEDIHRGGDLIGVIAPHHPLPALRVVRFADARQQHQLRIGEGIGAEDHQIGRLLIFLAGVIDISGADHLGLAVVEIELQHRRAGLQGEVRLLHQHRQDGGLRRGLGVIAAAELLAEAAIGARAQLQPERIGVGLRHVGRRLRERLVAQGLRGFGEQGRAVGLHHRRVGELARPRSLERIAAGLDRALDIAGLAADAAQTLHLVVIGFELGIGDRPILDGHVVGLDHRLAIALLIVGLEVEIAFEEAPGLAVPMHAGATHPLARQEGTPFADRQRGLALIVAEGESLVGGLLEQMMAPHIAQLVLVEGRGEIGGRVAPLAALDGQDVEAGIGQFLGDDGAGPAEPDQQHVDGRQSGRHAQLLTGVPRPSRPMGSSGTFSP